MTARNSKGFALVEAIAIVLIVAAVALVGVKVYGSHKDKAVANQNAASLAEQQAQLDAATASVPQIKTSSDLDKASQSLDQNDPGTINSNDSAELDKDINDL